MCMFLSVRSLDAFLDTLEQPKAFHFQEIRGQKINEWDLGKSKWEMDCWEMEGNNTCVIITVFRLKARQFI